MDIWASTKQYKLQGRVLSSKSCGLAGAHRVARMPLQDGDTNLGRN